MSRHCRRINPAFPIGSRVVFIGLLNDYPALIGKAATVVQTKGSSFYKLKLDDKECAQAEQEWWAVFELASESCYIRQTSKGGSR